ncbi:MAG: chondroitinase, partial [Pedobacter sp.]
MVKYSIIGWCLLMNFFCSTFTFAQADPLYDVILTRVRKDLIVPAQSSELTKKLSDSMLDDGSWADIDYNDRTMVKWVPSNHLKKIKLLIIAYLEQDKTSAFSEKLHGNIVKGFSYWYKKDPKSDNWWHNEIDVPQLLGQCLILMGAADSKLPSGLESLLLDRMDRGNMIARTGANKTDIALHVFYRSLLSKNKDLLELSITQLFLPVNQVHYSEGLQYDGSYLQHGPQLYIGGYGTVYVTGILKLATYVQGTPYALSSEKLKLFSDFYKDTYLKTIRGSYSDFNIQGRGISRKNILSREEEASKLNLFKKIDLENYNEWDAALKRIVEEETASYRIMPHHKHFWNGDYTIHLRPEYSFNVRIVSNRTMRSEVGNKENLIGKHLSDGATNIQLKGPEYYNIMPVWEWDKIPGTTSHDYDEDKPILKEWGEPGSNAFAGGVSDGTYGVTAYDMKYDSLVAKKSWFFFDKEVVCLGAGIKSVIDKSVVTTVNQCWLNGEVTLFNDSKKVKAISGALMKNGLIWHDNVGYYFPGNQNVVVSKEQQEGSWYRINKSGSKEKESGAVFKLFLN